MSLMNDFSELQKFAPSSLTLGGTAGYSEVSLDT